MSWCATMAQSVRNCVFCRVEIIQSLKINVNVNGNLALSNWKFLCLETFCMLYGIENGHPLINKLFPKKDIFDKLCSSCLQDVSNIYHIFWQLQNLEKKLAELQQVIVNKLGKQCETDLEENAKDLLELINSSTSSWSQPTTYSSRWKESQKSVEFEAMQNLIKEETAECHHDYEDYDDMDNQSSKSVCKRRKLNLKRRIVRQKITTVIPDNLDAGQFLCTEDPDICSRTYTKLKDLNLHIKQFHKYRDHVCDYEGCVQKFLSERKLVLHKINKHGLKKEWFQCVEDPDICNRKFSLEARLRDHIKQFHEGRSFVCDATNCSETFLNETKLRAHKEEAHNLPKQLVRQKEAQFIICEICGASVKPKRKSEHFRTCHLGREKFSCEHCTMTFDTSDQLETHESLHFSKASSFPFACVLPECQTILGSSMALRHHVKSCHLTGWFQCPLCDAKKPNEFLLKKHVKWQHEKVKNVMCDQCPKAFHSHKSLETHKRYRHMGIKHQCSICSRELTTKRTLERHMRSHLGEKPFKCKICPKAFGSLDGLKKHEEVHSGTKNYECELCGKRFKQMQNLKQHLKTQIHGGTGKKIAKSNSDEPNIDIAVEVEVLTS